jgi:hypothetical protein
VRTEKIAKLSTAGLRLTVLSARLAAAFQRSTPIKRAAKQGIPLRQRCRNWEFGIRIIRNFLIDNPD